MRKLALAGLVMGLASFAAPAAAYEIPVSNGGDCAPFVAVEVCDNEIVKDALNKNDVTIPVIVNDAVEVDDTPVLSNNSVSLLDDANILNCAVLATCEDVQIDHNPPGHAHGHHHATTVENTCTGESCNNTETNQTCVDDSCNNNSVTIRDSYNDEETTTTTDNSITITHSKGGDVKYVTPGAIVLEKAVPVSYTKSAYVPTRKTVEPTYDYEGKLPNTGAASTQETLGLGLGALLLGAVMMKVGARRMEKAEVGRITDQMSLALL